MKDGMITEFMSAWMWKMKGNHRMRIKRCLKIIVFCSIFLILLNRIYTILSWKDTAGDYYSSVDSFYELEKDVADVLFFGSSHCYCSVDPSVFWDKQGIASFNLAISGQDFAGTYYTLKEALKTQSPRVICMDLYYANATGYAVEGNLYRNTLPFKISKNSYEMVDELVEDETRKNEFWFRWPIFHTRYKEIKVEDFRTDLPVYLGYFATFVTQQVGDIATYSGEEVNAMPEEREEWLRKIVELAKENDVEVCFFIAPYVATENELKTYRYVKNWAEEQNIPLLDMMELSDELGMNSYTDFSDPGHTNHYGAQKVSRYLCNYVAEHYELTDHRGEDTYALWDENSKVRSHEVKNEKLRSVTSISRYLDMVSDMEDYVVVISNTGNYVAEGEDITDHLFELGIGEEFYTTGGVWIFEDAGMRYATSDVNALYHVDLEYSDLLVSRAEGINSVVVDRQQYQKVMAGINILVYDKVLGKVADCVGFSAAASYQSVR